MTGGGIPVVGVVVVAAGEPTDRLAAMAAAIQSQVGVRIELAVAVLPSEVDVVTAAVRAGGAVDRVIVVGNPGGARSSGLNACARALTTELLCRVDARSTLPPTYVRVCSERLARDPRVGVVGGHQVPHASSPSVMGRAVARVVADPLASGGAAYRRATASGPVDTVYLGAFRRHELLELGGWPEELAANEDFDLSARYRAAGRVVWLERGLDVAYEPRAGVRALWSQYAAFGRAKVAYWRLRSTRPGLRQWIGMVAPPLVVAVMAVLMAVEPQAGAVVAALGLATLGFAELRRGGERDARVRVVAALLTPLPALAFSMGALVGTVAVRPDGRSGAPPRGRRSGSAARAP